MPKSTNTIYYNNFDGEPNFSKNDLFCKIFTKYTYINSLPMIYQPIYVIPLYLIRP